MRTPLLPANSGKREYSQMAMSDALRFVHNDVFVAIEKQQAFPGQGVVSTFKTGYGYGLWLGILAGLQLDYIVVPPKKWQAEMIPGKEGSTKERSIAMAFILFPEVSLLPTERSKIPHDGMADSLCLAEYARRVHKFHQATKEE